MLYYTICAVYVTMELIYGRILWFKATFWSYFNNIQDLHKGKCNVELSVGGGTKKAMHIGMF